MLRERLRRVPKWLVVLCLLLAWFNWGIEDLRLGHVPDVGAHPLLAVSPPWWPLRAYVSRSGDEEVYFEDSRLLLGEDADLEYLAKKRQGDLQKDLADLTARVRPGPLPRVPYRDFPFEYPPLPLAVMALPRLFASSLAAYRLAYGILAALLTLGAAWIGVILCNDLGADGPKDPWRRMALFVLAMGPILVSRFDALPALLVAAAVVLLLRDRFFAAGLLAGAAVMTKLYPLLLLVPWAATLWGERRERGAISLMAGAAIAILGIASPFLWLCPEAFIRSTFVYGARPFQVEGLVGAATVLAVGKSAIVGSFGSYNVTSPEWLGKAWALLLPVAIVTCSVLATRQARREPPASQEERVRRLLAWTAAVLALVLITSKVLSPQYLIWLVPLGVTTTGPKLHRWAIAAAALTQVFYPILYDLFVEHGSRLVALIVVGRNAVLIGLAVAMLRAALDSSKHRAPRRARI
jgi:hypothetical protein